MQTQLGKCEYDLRMTARWQRHGLDCSVATSGLPEKDCVSVEKIIGIRKTFKSCIGICLHYQFECGPGPWLVQCSLSEGWTWSRVRAWLKDRETAIPLRQKYRLSDHAAALLEWITELRPEECLGAFTPEVEDHLELD